MKLGMIFLSTSLGLLFLLSLSALAAADVLDYVYSYVDTYLVVDVRGSAEDTVEVPIHFVNTGPVIGISFRVVYDSLLMTAVDVSVASTRLEDTGWYLAFDIDTPGELRFVGADLTTQNPLPPGAGAMATVLFSTDSGFTQGEVPLRFEDNLNEVPPIQNWFSDSAATAQFIPVQVDGFVKIGNRPPSLWPTEPRTISRFDTLCFVVSATDPDSEDSTLHYFIDTGDLAGSDDWSAEIDEETGEFCLFVGQRFVPPRPHDMSFNIVFFVNDFSSTPPESLEDRDTVVFTLNEPPFTLEVKKVFAFPGQQHVKVPFFLSNPWDDVGSFELLIEYDPSGGAVVGVELCDSAEVDDELHGGPDAIFYAPWHDDPDVYPEYFNYQLNAYGHSNWVQVITIQNISWPQQVTPDLPRDVQRLLFCVIFDVSPYWDGHTIVFHFRSRDCTNNTLADSDGQELWGPHPESPYPQSHPEWLHCAYEEYVMLLGGHGIGTQICVLHGDINCDCIPFSVADAMMFIGYLVYGDEALRNGDGLYYCGSFEIHCFASDIDDDGYSFTVNDLIKLIRIINGYEPPIPRQTPEKVAVKVEGGQVSIDAPVGAILFTFHGQGEVVGDGVAVGRVHGQTRVLAYSLEDRAVGPGPLFTMLGEVALVSVEAADFFGSPMVVDFCTVPRPFSLAQPHPNPFNPATELRYELAEDCHVCIQVFNILGQLVVTVVDAHQRAGSYAAAWDAGSWPSGVYVCRMQAGRFTVARKMILLR